MVIYLITESTLTVHPRKTSDCDLLQMTRDTFGAVAERPSGIRYLCMHCDISAFCKRTMQKKPRFSVRGFHPDHEVLYEQVGGVAAEPLGMAPNARPIGLQHRV